MSFAWARNGCRGLLLLSSMGDPLKPKELAAAGIEGHLVKPVRLPDLEAVLNRVRTDRSTSEKPGSL